MAIIAIAAKVNPLARALKNNLEFEKVEAVGGYVNFYLNRIVMAEEILKKIGKEKDKFGSGNLGKGKKILMEMSSPNIAKPFGIGHLRSTIIGNSIAEISKSLGFNVIKMNYLGDWGTQFGKFDDAPDGPTDAQHRVVGATGGWNSRLHSLRLRIV